MRPRITFRLKLILSYLTVIIISVGLVSLFLTHTFEKNYIATTKKTLIEETHLVAALIAPAIRETGSTARIQALVEKICARDTFRLTIIDSDGTVLADSKKDHADVPLMENHYNRPEVLSAFAGNTGMDIRRSATLKTDLLYAAVAVPGPAVGTKRIIRLALPLADLESAVRRIHMIIVEALLLALGLAAAIGAMLAGQIIRPINRMIQLSRKFAKGDFSRRMLYDSRDEIGELATTLNTMAAVIEDMIREREAQNQKFAAVFNSMIEGVIVVNKSGHIVSMNPAIENIFGVSRMTARGKLLLEAIRNNDIVEIVSRVLADGNILSTEINLVLPVRRTFQVNAAPVFETGVVSGCLIVIHDITEMRRLETLRRDFVANVSHELKTPLTSITGFAETLLEGALDDHENNRAFLTIIQEHAERLNDLVNDLLALSHLESKEMALHKKELALKTLVDKVVFGFRSQIKKKGIGITNELPADLALQADEARLGQVFTNLIDNAIKFNKKGGTVTIGASQNDGYVTITVEDTGPGIPEKDVPRIFERFYRVDKARSRELGGTGLGLSIVKHIVELHGGTVSVTSTEGLGSQFHITLPR